MARRETADVLRRARETLELAQLGLADLTGDDPKRRIPGLRNAIIFGRSVTFIIQNMRTVDEALLNAWYVPRQEAMRADPLMQYFNKIRTSLEKEGRPDAGVSMLIEYLNMADLAPLMANPPPGATGFFIGDQTGGSGWKIELPDGSTEHYYVALPESVRTQWSLHLPDPPTEHLGQPIADTSAAGLTRLYLAYIADFLQAAERQFGT